MDNSCWRMWWGLGFIPIIIILAIYFFVKSLQAKARATSESPTDIWKKTYANGEITKELFEEMKKHIS